MLGIARRPMWEGWYAVPEGDGVARRTDSAVPAVTGGSPSSDSEARSQMTLAAQREETWTTPMDVAGTGSEPAREPMEDTSSVASQLVAGAAMALHLHATKWAAAATGL